MSTSQGRAPYDAGKTYFVGGAVLNRLFEAIGTNRLLKSSEYELETFPGVGTRLKGIKADADPRRWDLVPDPDGGHKLHAPLLYAGLGDFTKLTVTNDPVAFTAGQIVALVVDDLTADPYTLTLAVIDATDPFYEFDEDDDLTDARFPLWLIEEEEPPGGVRLGEVWGTKLVTDAVMALASHYVLVPDRPVAKPAPRLISL